MDRHELAGSNAADVAAAHMQDVAIQEQYGVEYVNYWYDYEQQRAFCLARGPDRDAVGAVHSAAHGLIANEIIEVDADDLARFMGGMVQHKLGEAYVEAAFRAIMFTDIEGSTSLTQQLGDAGAMVVLRRHDQIVRAALAKANGTEVKHTGDGIMASFRSVAAAIEAAVLTQRGLAEAAAAGEMPVGVRIGIAAGEPVSEGKDLFGTAVQLAARLCAKAPSHGVLVTAAVRDLAMGKGFRFAAGGTLRLKGFGEPVRTAQVVWQAEEAS